MAKTSRIYVRIEPEIKDKAIALFDDIGISLSDAVSLFLRQSLIAKDLPFSVEEGSIKPIRKTSQM